MHRISRMVIAGLMLAGGGCDLFGSSSPDMDAGPTGGGVGAACTSALNCRVGLACEANTCQPTGEGLDGSVCSLTADCGDGLYCGPRRTCTPAGAAGEGESCESTADCEAGLSCAVVGLRFACGPNGDGDLGAQCAADTDCLAGLRCLRAGEAAICSDPPIIDGDAGALGSLPTLPFWSGEACETDDGPPTAYFEVPRFDGSDNDFYRLPFPNDVRRSATGLNLEGHPSPATALDVDVLGRHITAAADLDGFATNPVIYFRFSRAFNFEDVTADRVLLVDISPDSPEFRRNLARGWLYTAGAVTRYICPNWMGIRRGHGAPLRPGTTYAALLLNGIRTNADDGLNPLGRDEDLDALLAAERPMDDALGTAWDRYQALRDYLADAETPDAASILNAAVFTTQRADAMPAAIRTAIRREDTPTLSEITVCGEGVTSPCEDDQRSCGAANEQFWEVHARITLPRLQQGTPPYLEPEDGGGVVVDGSGVPIVQATDPVCMVMTIPKSVTAAPATGFPVALYAHGTGGAFTAPVSNGLAGTFATEDGGSGAPNAITVGLDMPLHGSRRGESTLDPDLLVFNFANPRAARGNFLQGAADLLVMVRFLEEATLPAADMPTDFDISFDASRIVLFAHSQGATHAQLMAPYEPALRAVLLSGAGGDLTESLLTKTEPVNIAGALPLALLDIDASGGLTVGDYHPALALFQTFYERVDPVNFGRLYRSEPVGDTIPHVFMTYGLDDSYSTERTMAAFARSAALPIVAPELVDIGLSDPVEGPLSSNVSLGDNVYTVGLRQYATDDGDDGHFVAFRTTQGRADATRFLLEALAGATPPIGP